MFRFRDDIEIELSAEGSGTRVRVRSASRVGRYDFGQNARHIRMLFRELAKDPCSGGEPGVSARRPS